MAHTNGIESVEALLKRGLTGTYHNLNVKRLPRYIDEFSLRLNKGVYKVGTIDKIKSLTKSFGDKRITYKKLVI